MIPLFTLASLVALLGLVLLWLSARKRRASGLPGERIIYSDTRQWGSVEKPLFDGALGLTGKPDYLVESGKQFIPVEVKSTRGVTGPLDAHIYQLAAYCLLVKHAYGIRPDYGILHYPDRTYQIDFTPALEADLLAILDEMRVQDRRKEVERSHQSEARCRGCGFRNQCDQRLV